MPPRFGASPPAAGNPAASDAATPIAQMRGRFPSLLPFVAGRFAR
jgi:hypothetical protein